MLHPKTHLATHYSLKLIRCAAAGNVTRMRECLARGAHLHYAPPYQPEKTALASAARFGHFGAMELLLHSGADPNQGAASGRFLPLNHTVWRGDSAQFDLLLAHGADVTLTHGLLEAAASVNHEYIFRTLAQQGASWDGVLPSCIETGNDLFLKRSLSLGAMPTSQHAFYACRLGRLECLQLLAPHIVHLVHAPGESLFDAVQTAQALQHHECASWLDTFLTTQTEQLHLQQALACTIQHDRHPNLRI